MAVNLHKAAEYQRRYRELHSIRSYRFTQDIINRIHAIQNKLELKNFNITVLKSDIVRSALERGLDLVEKELEHNSR